jgi:MarR family transcriptional regulator, organic hydroperoxide resistance regulator
VTEHLPLDQLLVRAGQAAHSCAQRAAAAHGLTATALGVLGVLAQGDAVSHRELAGRLGVTPATLTPLVDGLEAAGAIVRARDRRDRRMVRVSITPAGRERFAAASEQVARDVGERLPRPAPADAAVVRAYLLSVLAAVGDGPGPE